MLPLFADTSFESIRTLLNRLAQMPTVWLIAMIVPLAISAWRFRIFPSGRLLALWVIPFLLTIASTFYSGLLWPALFVDLLILLAASLDWMLLPGRDQFSAKRKILKIASIAKKHDVEIALANRSRRRWRIDVKDQLPEAFTSETDFFPLSLRASSQAHLDYSFKSSSRGRFTMNCVYLRIRSRLRLWNSTFSLPCASEIYVFPDLKQIAEYELLARTNRLSLLGVRRTRRVGQDHDFERLRDYNIDDNFKNIDWRITAKRQKLTVKDYQSTQSQRVIFLVDCGRMMTGRSGDISLLDHSLNAMLMLAYVALSRGDSVGMISFSDRIHRYVPPRHSMAQMNRLLHASFDQHPQMVESRYDEAFLYLRTHCLRRSLVVVITNLIDDVNANQIQQYLRSLVGRHLPLGILMRDHQIFDALDRADLQAATASGDEVSPGLTKQQLSNLYEASAASDVLMWRQQVLSDLQHLGVLTLDVFPEELTARLINEYLMIKARHLL